MPKILLAVISLTLIGCQAQLTLPSTCEAPGWKAGFPFASGAGTTDNPFVICSADQLSRLGQTPSYYVNAFRLGTDLDLNGVALIPIGSYSLAQSSGTGFSGVFDGGGYTISNLTLPSSTDSPVGLFVYTNAATLQNLTLKNAAVKGKTDVGALVGYALNTSITNVSGQGTVSSTDSSGSNVGGLVGFYSTSLVGTTYVFSKNSFNGAVSGALAVGGLIGRGAFTASSAASLSQNTVLGTVSGAAGVLSGSVGGIAGLLRTDVATVAFDNGQANITVTGADTVGGLIGNLIQYSADSSVSVTNSTATGSVVSTAYPYVGSTFGGIIGIYSVPAGASGTLSNLTFSGNVFSSGGFSGGGLGTVNNKGILSISKCSATGTFGSNGLHATLISNGIFNGSVGGGFIGVLNSYAGAQTSLSRSFFKGTVDYTSNTNAVQKLAGLIGGINNSVNVTISDCYAQGTLILTGLSNSMIGGLIGGTGAGITLTNTYASYTFTNFGAVTATGGLIGSNGGAATITNSYWNSDLYATGIGAGPGVGAGQASSLTTSQLANSANFPGWNFTNIWTLGSVTMPVLR